MKPDVYMPFFGPAFVQAVRSHGRAVAGSYIFVLVHYWFHEHCCGLRDDNDMLRRVCECEKDEWQETKEKLFDNDKFFTLGVDGLWHQKRADYEWAKACNKYDSAVERAKLGAKTRWKKRK